jgi:hypothetical protein
MRGISLEDGLSGTSGTPSYLFHGLGAGLPDLAPYVSSIH